MAEDHLSKPREVTMRVERRKPTFEFRLRRKLKQWDRLFNGKDNGKEHVKKPNEERRWAILKRTAEIDRRINALEDSGESVKWVYKFDDAELAEINSRAVETALKRIKDEHSKLYEAIVSGTATDEQEEEYDEVSSQFLDEEIELLKQEVTDEKGHWSGNLELGELYDEYWAQWVAFYNLHGEYKMSNKFKGLRYTFRHELAGGEGGHEYSSSDNFFKIFLELVNDMKFYQLNKFGDTVEARDIEAERKRDESLDTRGRLELFKGELREIDSRDIMTWADHLVKNRMTAQDVREGKEIALMGCPSPEYVQRILANLKAGGKVTEDALAELDALGDMLAKTVTDLSNHARALDELEASGSIQQKGINTLKRLAGDMSNPTNMFAIAGFAVGAALLYRMFGKDNSSDGFMSKALKTGGIAVGAALVGGFGLSAIGRLRDNQKTALDEAGVSFATFDMESDHMQWIRKQYDKIAEGGEHMKGLVQIMGMSAVGFADICEWMLGTMDGDPARIEDGLCDEIESKTFKDFNGEPAPTKLCFYNALERLGQKMGIDKSKFGGDNIDYLKACLAEYRRQYCGEVVWSAGTVLYDIEMGSGRPPTAKKFDLEAFAMASPVIETLQVFAEDPDEVLVESVTGNRVRINGVLWEIREDESGEFDSAPERPLILKRVRPNATDEVKSVELIPFGPRSREWYQSRAGSARIAALTLIDASNGGAREAISKLYAEGDERFAPERFEFNPKKNVWEFKDREFSQNTKEGIDVHLGISNEPLPIEFMQDEKTGLWGARIPGKDALLYPDAGETFSGDIEDELVKDLVLDKVKDFSAGLLGPVQSLELYDKEGVGYYKEPSEGKGALVYVKFDGGHATLQIKNRELAGITMEKEFLDLPVLKQAREALARSRSREYRKEMESDEVYKRYLAAYEGPGDEGLGALLAAGGEVAQQILQAAGGEADLLYMRGQLHRDTGEAVLDLLQERYALELEMKLKNAQGARGSVDLDRLYSDIDQSLKTHLHTLSKRTLEVEGELADTMEDEGAWATGRKRVVLASQYPAEMMEIPAGDSVQCVWLLRETFALVDKDEYGFDIKGPDGAQQMTKYKRALAKAVYRLYNVARMNGADVSDEQRWVRAKQIREALVVAIRKDLAVGTESNLAFAGITLDKVFDVDTVVAEVKSAVGSPETFLKSGYEKVKGVYGTDVPTTAPSKEDLEGRPRVRAVTFGNPMDIINGPSDQPEDLEDDEWEESRLRRNKIDEWLDYELRGLRELRAPTYGVFANNAGLLETMIELKKSSIRERINDLARTKEQSFSPARALTGAEWREVAMQGVRLLEHDMRAHQTEDPVEAVYDLAEQLSSGHETGGERWAEANVWFLKQLLDIRANKGIDSAVNKWDLDQLKQDMLTYMKKIDWGNVELSAGKEREVTKLYAQYYLHNVRRGTEGSCEDFKTFNEKFAGGKMSEVAGWTPVLRMELQLEDRINQVGMMGKWGDTYQAYARARFTNEVRNLDDADDQKAAFDKLLKKMEVERGWFMNLKASGIEPTTQVDSNEGTSDLFDAGIDMPWPLDKWSDDVRTVVMFAMVEASDEDVDSYADAVTDHIGELLKPNGDTEAKIRAALGVTD